MPGVIVLDSVINSPEMEKSKVCRCLFGRPDHDKLRKDLDSEMAQMREESRRYVSDKYNFNTEDDEPLEGRYEWQLIKQTDDVPSFYRKGYTSKHRTITRRRQLFNSDSNTPERPSTPVELPVDGTVCTTSPSAENGDLQNRLETTPISRDSSFSSESSSPDSAVNDSRPVSVGNLVQTKLEDYLKVRKRRLNLDDDKVRTAKSPRL
ncbi:hypothetical protein CHS0354_010035 [Potamilus streckersoni]|uniref:Cyclin-dependent kinase inhibitor domain-containing protein n=1 Tax=Potamilus streckersoni TaxID=2493646 RepID=A0AAE0VTE5_9BIVA|nr:hypothetical protein CHS0354_010035 [Potamilus streckersoni]